MGPDHSIPHVREYRLDVDVDFSGNRWSGAVAIDLDSAPGTISLDAVDLEIQSVFVGAQEYPFVLRPSEGRIEIHSETAGPVTVVVKFAGSVKPRALIGLYRSRFGDASILTTQCAPTGARRIFPCIDRPDRKAPLRLSVTAEDALEVVSNAAPEEVRSVGVERRWTFGPTPPMSTYLFYLGIGKFERREQTVGPVKISVLAPPGRGSSGEFLLNRAGPLLSFYEEYYSLPYPLRKLDLIDVPESAFGGMENWGAIAFCEQWFLVDETTSSPDRRSALRTLAHELAHMWFGNLVTMRWWNDIWLNESFATLMEQKVLDLLFPDFEAGSEFLLDWTGPALLDDSLRHTHPVSTPVERPEEVDEIFDVITYGKGASVLRMMDAYLGPERFRAGVHEYLELFRYSNAGTADLWEALGRATGLPVSALLSPWIDQSGVPVIGVRTHRNGISLDQRRFYLDGRHDSARWPIPVIGEVNGHALRLLFDSETQEIPCDPVRSIGLNREACGFYRVLYDPPLYELVARTFPERPPRERWSLLQDLLAFVFSGDVPLATYLRFVNGTRQETDPLVARSVTAGLTLLGSWIVENATFSETARSFLADQSNRLGDRASARERESESSLRHEVALARAYLDDGFARLLAERFPSYERLDPDLRAAVAVARARTGGEVAHRELVRALERAPPAAESIRLERALASVPDEHLLQATLDLTRTELISRSDVPLVLVTAARNPSGRSLTWRWLQLHLPELEIELQGTPFISDILEQGLPYVGLGRLDEVDRFLRDHPPRGADRGIARGLEKLAIAERLVARYGRSATESR